MKTKRDLTLLYQNENDLQITKDRKKTDEAIKVFEQQRKEKKSYLKNLKDFKKALEQYNQIFEWPIRKELGYFYFRNMIQMQNKKIKAKLNQAEEHATKNSNKLNFFELDLGKMSKEMQKKCLQNKEFKEYKHFLKKIFEQAKYNLSEAEEKILNIKSKTSYSNRIQMLEEFLSKEQRSTLVEETKKEPKKIKKEVKTFEEIMSLLKHTNKKIRDNAAKNLNDILEKYIDIAEVELNSVFEHKKQNDELRKFPRPDSSRHLQDDMETKIVDSLIQSVQDHFDIAQDFYKLKARLLKVPKLAYHERSVPIGKIEKIFDYKEATKITHQVFQSLDPEFDQIFTEFCNTWRIDVYPKTGKRGGACNIWFGKNEPNFVMLNYTNTLNDITTLAHEMGHAINTQLSQRNQNALNFGYGTATAEVASTFIEDFVFEKLLEIATPEEQLTILMEKLNDSISSIHRQVACYLFETELHKEFRQKGYLDQKTIGTIFQKNMKAYMGKAVEQSPWSQNRRIYRSHIRSFFYVYSYAGGLLISKALQAETRKNPQFVSKIKKHFLAAGWSESPKTIFKHIGIDISQKSFRKQGLQEIAKQLKKAEKLAKQLKKI